MQEELVVEEGRLPSLTTKTHYRTDGRTSGCIPVSRLQQSLLRLRVAHNPVKFKDPDGHRPCGSYCRGDWITSDINFGAQWEGEWDPGKQKERSEKIDAAFFGGVETIASVASEPIDWALALKDGWQWYDGIGFLPFIPATVGKTVGKYSDETITLFRAVSKGEYYDIMTSRIFRPAIDGTSMDGKWFSETLEGATEWGKRMFDEFTVIAVNIPRSVADEMFRVRKLDGIANARFAIDDMLDKFNDAIQDLWTIP